MPARPKDVKMEQKDKASVPSIPKIVKTENPSFINIIKLSTIISSVRKEGKSSVSEFELLLDSGAEAHVFNHLKWFTHIGKAAATIKSASGNAIPCLGTGTVTIIATVGGKEHAIVLNGAHYAPDAGSNYISQGTLEQLGWHFKSDLGEKDTQTRMRWVIPNLKGYLHAERHPDDTSYYFKGVRPVDRTIAGLSLAYANSRDRLLYLHRCLGHISRKDIRNMAAARVVDLQDYNLRMDDLKADFSCPACLIGGMRNYNFKRKPTKLVVTADVSGTSTAQTTNDAATEPATVTAAPAPLSGNGTQDCEGLATPHRHTPNHSTTSPPTPSPCSLAHLTLVGDEVDLDASSRGVAPPWRVKPTPSDHPVTYLSFDAFGPTQVAGPRGERYGWVLNTVEASGGSYGTSFATKTRDAKELVKLLSSAIDEMERISGGKVRFVTLDGAKEHTSNAVRMALSNRSIRPLVIPAHISQLNGHAEMWVRVRKIDISKLILDTHHMADAASVELPTVRTLWVDALQVSCHIRNHIIRPDGTNAVKRLTGFYGRLERLLPFASGVIAYRPKATRLSEIEKGEPAAYISYDPMRLSYRVYGLYSRGHFYTPKIKPYDQLLVEKERERTMDAVHTASTANELASQSAADQATALTPDLDAGGEHSATDAGLEPGGGYPETFASSPVSPLGGGTPHHEGMAQMQRAMEKDHNHGYPLESSHLRAVRRSKNLELLTFRLRCVQVAEASDSARRKFPLYDAGDFSCDSNADGTRADSTPEVVKLLSKLSANHGEDEPDQQPNDEDEDDEPLDPSDQAILDRINMELTTGERRPPSDPKSFSAAMSDPIYGHVWKRAIQKEWNKLVEKETFDIVDRDESINNVMRSLWAFRVVYAQDLDGKIRIAKFKARFVADGSSQRQGVDYFESFSPVLKYDSLRILLAIAAREKFRVHQYDAVAAYLNAPVEEDIFMALPKPIDGVPHQMDPKKKVAKLRKSLYGCKQSGRNWYRALHAHLLKLGYVRSRADPCVFRHPTRDIIVGVYVDDFIVLYKDPADRDFFHRDVHAKFPLEDRGPLSWMLGMQIVQRQDFSITISMSKFISQLLEKFGLQNAKGEKLPMDPGAKLKPNQEDNQMWQNNIPYKSLVGSLLFVMVTGRPDIAYSVGQVCRYMSSYNHSHWNAAKRILRYLKDTADELMIFKAGKQDDDGIIVFSDSSFADCSQDRKSTAGYIAYLGSCPIAWRSKKLSDMATSTATAEYMILCEAAKVATWMRNFLHELGLSSGGVPSLMEDNQAAIRLASQMSTSERTKHIDLRHHYLRSQVDSQELRVIYCPTTIQVADIFTKPISTGTFDPFARSLMGYGFQIPDKMKCMQFK